MLNLGSYQDLPRFPDKKVEQTILSFCSHHTCFARSAFGLPRSASDQNVNWTLPIDSDSTLELRGIPVLPSPRFGVSSKLDRLFRCSDDAKDCNFWLGSWSCWCWYSSVPFNSSSSSLWFVTLGKLWSSKRMDRGGVVTLIWKIHRKLLKIIPNFQRCPNKFWTGMYKNYTCKSLKIWLKLVGTDFNVYITSWREGGMTEFSTCISKGVLLAAIWRSPPATKIRSGTNISTTFWSCTLDDDIGGPLIPTKVGDLVWFSPATMIRSGTLIRLLISAANRLS